jgi:hypothetical protein
MTANQNRNVPAAVRATFERRGTALPVGMPVGLSEEFVRESQSMWHAFVTRSDITAPVFVEVVAVLREQCLRLLQAARDKER